MVQNFTDIFVLNVNLKSSPGLQNFHVKQWVCSNILIIKIPLKVLFIEDFQSPYNIHLCETTFQPVRIHIFLHAFQCLVTYIEICMNIWECLYFIVHFNVWINGHKYGHIRLHVCRHTSACMTAYKLMHMCILGNIQVVLCSHGWLHIWWHTWVYKAAYMSPFIGMYDRIQVGMHAHIWQHIRSHAFECMLTYIFAYLVL